MNSRNKKSAPGGTQILKQDNSTMPERRSHAQILFDRIGTGKKNAVRVSNRDNREFRRLVSQANKNGDVIINNGDGYYRAGPDDKDEVNHYVRSELHRAQEIEDKAYAMKDAYYGRY